VLDLNQEEVAKRWIGEGHRILFGVAGSGKTVILLARARYQARLQPDHDILVLCYNTVLMHYLAKCLADYDNITVRTFHSWAGEAVGDSSWWTGPGSEEEKGQTLLKKLRAQGVRKRYHCILILSLIHN